MKTKPYASDDPKSEDPPGGMAISENSATESTELAKILCVIRDCTANAQLKPFNFSISSTVDDLITQISKDFEYEKGTFKVLLENATSQTTEIDMNDLEKRLSDICIVNGKNRFQITEVDGMRPTKLPPQAQKGSVSFNDMGPAPAYEDVVTGEAGTSGSTVIPYNGSSASAYSPPPAYSSFAQPDVGYRGLVNQAMTCYLNSLLQTLFMTPEFRNAIYTWKYDPSDDQTQKPERCIPYQLQQLFIDMETSKRRSVETTSVTKSFGWDSSEAWQQHDVQELCRVMFDALEQKWKTTEQKELFNQLYTGQFKDYVKCLECKKESARNSAYMDIQLVIKPFGATNSYKSVEEALDAFVAPEILDGGNQYMCENCNAKRDAHKGLRFISFPYLMTLQLKRFDFDFRTMNRMKLNDRMTFPYILDLNPMLHGETDQLPPTPIRTEPLGGGFSERMDADSLLRDVDQDVDEKYSGYLSPEDKQDIIKEKGEYVYELFSIMIHSGSAAGGHYYAYIKCVSDGKWYSFNDQNVALVDLEAIRKTYGGVSNGSLYSSTYSSSTNAYMLMYRKIAPDNAEFDSIESHPHLTELIKSMKEQSEVDHQLKEYERSLCKLRCFCQLPHQAKPEQREIKIPKDCTLGEATEIAYKLFGLVGINKSDTRLVKSDSENILLSFEPRDPSVPRESQQFGTLVGGAKAHYTFDLLLEIKQPVEKWQVYKIGGLTLKVCIVDLESRQVSVPINVRVNGDITVNDLKRRIADVTGVSQLEDDAYYTKCMRLVGETFGDRLEYLSDGTKSLRHELGAYSNRAKIYMDLNPPEEETQHEDFTTTRLYEVIDQYLNVIHMKISLPTQGEVIKYKEKERRRKRTRSTSNQQAVKAIHTDPLRDARIPDPPPLPPNRNFTAALQNTASDSVRLAEKSDGGSRCTCEKDVTECTCGFSAITSSMSKSEASGGGESPSATRIPETEPCWGEPEDMEPNHWFQPRAITYCIFKVNHDESDSRLQMFDVDVDRRIRVKTLREKIKSIIDVETDMFKLYKIYSNNQEFEYTTNIDGVLGDLSDIKLTVKLGRPLEDGEYKIRIHEFLLNAKAGQEHSRYLVDLVIRSKQTIAEAKLQLVDELKDELDLELPTKRFRLRKKNYRNPGQVYSDKCKFDDDVIVYNNCELYLQQVPTGEPAQVGEGDLCVFVRRWLPSSHELGEIEELILQSSVTVDELKHNLTFLTDIPEDRIEIAKVKGNFPGETPLTDIQTVLDWNPKATKLTAFPLFVMNGGTVLLYRDADEALEKLTPERRKELELSDPNLANRHTYPSSYSRKEKALRIITDEHVTTSDLARDEYKSKYN